MGRHTPFQTNSTTRYGGYDFQTTNLGIGTATTEQKAGPRDGYQPVKMKWHGSPTVNELLELLHRLMSHQQIGHPLSGLYYHLKRIYEEAKQQQSDSNGPSVDNLRIRLLTRGEVMQQNLPEAHNIHPHQLQLPESVNQLAQLFFVDGDDGLPPAAEQGVMLKTKSGALTILPWWDNWIDGALCPLLFPCGGSVWKPSLPLATPDSAAALPLQQKKMLSGRTTLMPMKKKIYWLKLTKMEKANNFFSKQSRKKFIISVLRLVMLAPNNATTGTTRIGFGGRDDWLSSLSAS
uniref:Uncharacterized protein n=1 Tax=Globodera pallida TaxID=36090 RepID=A0A183C072_GLOPA